MRLNFLILFCFSNFSSDMYFFFHVLYFSIEVFIFFYCYIELVTCIKSIIPSLTFTLYKFSLLVIFLTYFCLCYFRIKSFQIFIYSKPLVLSFTDSTFLCLLIKMSTHHYSGLDALIMFSSRYFMVLSLSLNL